MVRISFTQMMLGMFAAALPAVKRTPVKKIIPNKPFKTSIYIIDTFAVKKRRGDNDMVKCLFFAVKIMAPPLFGGQFIP